MRWGQCLRLHGEALATIDFVLVEVATGHGLVTYDVLVVMERATRRVHVAEGHHMHAGMRWAAQGQWRGAHHRATTASHSAPTLRAVRTLHEGGSAEAAAYTRGKIAP